jgi:hypothetical protein
MSRTKSANLNTKETFVITTNAFRNIAQHHHQSAEYGRGTTT